MPLKGDTNPWRDIGHARWYDPWAVLENPESQEFKDAVRDENTRWTHAVKRTPGVKRWLTKFKSYGAAALPDDPAYAHTWYTWNNREIRIQYTPGHRQTIWLDNKCIHRDVNALETDPASDLYFTIADVGNGDETLELTVWAAATRKKVWSVKHVGPTAAFVGNYLYYQTVENQLRYPGIIRVQKHNGKQRMRVFHESDKRFQVELIKPAGQPDLFFRIANALSQRLGRIPHESANFQWMTPLTESSLFPVSKQVWLSDRAIHNDGQTIRLPDGQHTVDAMPCDDGVRIVTTHNACMNLYTFNLQTNKFTPVYESKAPNEIRITDSTVLYMNPGTPTRVVGHDGHIVTFPEPLRFAYESHGQAKSRDGTRVPYTLVSKTRNPLFLLVEAYGSYGISCHRSYPTRWLPWLDNGYAVAVASPRGGREDGDPWYDGGRTALRKHHTFEDTAAVIKAAQQRLHVVPSRTVFYGRSAGGLLAANIAHTYHNLVGAVYAEVPYVDVLRTTTNPALPLTQLEYDEFGDPAKRPDEYAALQHISPVDTVPLAPKHAPLVLVRTGVHDAQVLPYEALKWAKKLRCAGWNVLVGIDGNGGHFAATDVMYGQQAEDAALITAHLTSQKRRMTRKSGKLHSYVGTRRNRISS